MSVIPVRLRLVKPGVNVVSALVAILNAPMIVWLAGASGSQFLLSSPGVAVTVPAVSILSMYQRYEEAGMTAPPTATLV